MRTAQFLEGRPVNPEDDSYYDLPSPSDRSANVYLHCVRAILRSLRFGAHGLPLIGSGDWNDGMNLVGRHGKGESVWLAFFLCHVLDEFAKVARLRDDASFAERCETEADAIARNASSRTRGMAAGIAAHTSTTVRHSARSAMPNAKSTRSRRVGRCCPVPVTMRAHALQWTR